MRRAGDWRAFCAALSLVRSRTGRNINHGAQHLPCNIDRNYKYKSSKTQRKQKIRLHLVCVLDQTLCKWCRTRNKNKKRREKRWIDFECFCQKTCKTRSEYEINLLSNNSTFQVTCQCDEIRRAEGETVSAPVCSQTPRLPALTCD